MNNFLCSKTTRVVVALMVGTSTYTAHAQDVSFTDIAEHVTFYAQAQSVFFLTTLGLGNDYSIEYTWDLNFLDWSFVYAAVEGQQFNGSLYTLNAIGNYEISSQTFSWTANAMLDGMSWIEQGSMTLFDLEDGSDPYTAISFEDPPVGGSPGLKVDSSVMGPGFPSGTVMGTFVIDRPNAVTLRSDGEVVYTPEGGSPGSFTGVQLRFVEGKWKLLWKGNLYDIANQPAPIWVQAIELETVRDDCPPEENLAAFITCPPLGTSGLSTVTNVPEPASWAMMIAGFGAIGIAIRRRRSAVCPGNRVEGDSGNSVW